MRLQSQPANSGPCTVFGFPRPYVEAEVFYATRHEYACTAVDILARRTRLAFVDAQAALRVIEIMSKELGWSRARQWEEYTRGM